MTTTDEIADLESRRWAAMIDKDLDALDALFHDRMQYTHSNAMVDDKASYIKAIDERVFDYRSADVTDREIAVVGDTALVTGRAQFHVVAGGHDVNLDARFSAVWVRDDGRWRFLAWQSTSRPS